jgi:membrane associated rhomboid family serine protease
MTPTPVGMRCPECANQRTRVVQNPVGTASGFGAFPATAVLIAINVIVYLIELAGGGGGGHGLFKDFTVVRIYDMGGLWGPAVSEGGEWWRMITAGFVHVSLLHIAFNMYLLFILGRLMEPSIGTPRFVVLYFASLLAGSFAALLIEPNTVSAGASGAIFGVLGATFIVARGRRLDSVVGQIGGLILLNLVFTFAGGNISIGAHLGGLACGVLCGFLIVAGERGKLGETSRNGRLAVELGGMAALGVLSFVLGLAVA